MTKLIIAALTLAMLSTATLAAKNRNYDLTDLKDVNGYDSDVNDYGSATDIHPFAAAEPGVAVERPLTNFERMLLNMEKNQSSSH